MSVATLYNKLKGTLAGAESSPDADLQDLFTDEITVLNKPAADAAAGDASTIGAFKAPYDCKVMACDIVPNAALTAHDTTNAIVTLAKADGAGGAATTIGALTTNLASGNWVADVFKALTLTAAAVNVNDGQLVTLKITKGSTGVVVPVSAYVMRLRRR